MLLQANYIFDLFLSLNKLLANFMYIIHHFMYIHHFLILYNKRNAHFDVQELLLQFWTEHHETWQKYGEALGA